VKNVDQTYLPFEGAQPRGHYIYRPWITDPKTGKRKYPRRAKVFKIWVPYDKAA
jgi:hypothetical protein